MWGRMSSTGTTLGMNDAWWVRKLLRRVEWVRRLWIEAAVVGSSIGVLVLALQYTLVHMSLPLRSLAVLVASVLLCLLQIVVSNWKRNKSR